MAYFCMCCLSSRFNDKRTPSWTDRILWRGFADDERYHSNAHQDQEGVAAGQPQQQRTNSGNSTFASVQEVISSDHEPVYCTLDLPREKAQRQKHIDPTRILLCMYV